MPSKCCDRYAQDFQHEATHFRTGMQKSNTNGKATPAGDTFNAHTQPMSTIWKNVKRDRLLGFTRAYGARAASFGHSEGAVTIRRSFSTIWLPMRRPVQNQARKQLLRLGNS